MKVREAANYVGVSAWKIRETIRRGELPYIPGSGGSGAWLIDRADLDRWVDSQKMMM